jgi:hypothetical protein
VTEPGRPAGSRRPGRDGGGDAAARCWQPRDIHLAGRSALKLPPSDTVARAETASVKLNGTASSVSRLLTHPRLWPFPP